MSSQKMGQVIALSRAGKNEEARQILNEILREEPNHPIARMRLNDLTRPKDPQPKPVNNGKELPAAFRGVPSYPASLWVIIFLTIALCITSIMSIRLGIVTRSLEIEMTNLKRHDDNLTTQYDTLDTNCQALYTQYKKIETGAIRLGLENLDLKTDYETLLGEYSGLQANYTALQAQYDSLAIDYNNISGQYSQLSQTAIKPPYIYVYNRQVWLAYVRTDNYIAYWQFPFGQLEADLNRGNSLREKMDLNKTSYLLNVYDPLGNRETVLNMGQFVDPVSLQQQASQLYYDTGGGEAFLREAWYIVTEMSMYSTDEGSNGIQLRDGTETPRFPLETLLAGGGDCEDTSILLASLILAAPVDWDVDLVHMDGRHFYDPQELNHLIVYVNTGQNEYWIETTQHEYFEFYQYDVHGFHEHLTNH